MSRTTQLRKILTKLPFLTVVVLSIFLILTFYVEFSRSVTDQTSVGEIGSFIAGAASPLLIIWLIYSVIIQSNEMSSQRQIRKFTTAESILNESRQLLNSEIKHILSSLGVEEEERSVFDLDELPYTLSESKQFIELESTSFATNAILYQSAKNFVTIYDETLSMLQRVDRSGKVSIFLTKSRYEFIRRKLDLCMIREAVEPVNF